MNGTVESLQSDMIFTMSHWSSGLPVCFPPQGSQVQIPWGDLCETGILLLAISRYVIDHQHRFVPNNCHKALVPTMWQSHLISHSFPVPVSRSLQVSLLASQPTESAAGGEPCGEPAISHKFTMSHWSSGLPVCFLPQGSQVQIPWGDLCETGILLLAMSRYIPVESWLHPCWPSNQLGCTPSPLFSTCI